MLSYATRDTDANTDIIPAVEAMIYARCPLHVIATHFLKTQQAADYLARSMQRRFVYSSAGRTCAACEGNVGDMIVQLLWTARAKLRPTEFAVSDPHAYATFSTYHPICTSCFEKTFRAVRRRRRWVIGLKWSQALIWGSFFALGYAQVQSLQEPIAALIAFLATIALSFLAIVAAKLVSQSLQYALPKSIRHLVPREVEFSLILGADERNVDRSS